MEHESLLIGGLPVCQKCKNGIMIPLSDFGAFTNPKTGETTAVGLNFRAWVCNNPACNYNIRGYKGEIIVDQEVERGRRKH